MTLKQVICMIKLTAKTVDEDPASCKNKRWISRKEIKSAKI